MTEAEVDCDAIPEFTQDRTLLLVEYPGIVKNTDKMIKTLGGLKNISETYNEENRRLDLRFRPDDPCCHTVCADRSPVSALLLKVKNYRRKKKPGDPDKSDEFRYRPEITGIVNTAFRFTSLCDFQYLPLYNDVENEKLVNMIPHLGVGMKKFDDSLFTEDSPLFLPPAMFSRFDTQHDALFTKEPRYRTEGNQHSDKIGVTRPRRSHNAQYIKFDDNWTPKEPLVTAKDAFEKCSGTLSHLVDDVKKLFKERPVWSKNALSYKLNCSHDDMKHLLPMFAYYFITGPWRSLWVRLGYDPRKDKDAMKYQLLDFRVRQGLNTPNIPIKAKRSTLQYRLPNLMPKNRKLTHAVEDIVAKMADGTENSSDTLPSDAIYIYRPGILPIYRQTFYQICDIRHPGVETLVESHFDEVSNRDACDGKSGWLPDETAAAVRDLLTKDIQKTLENSQLNPFLPKMAKNGRKKERLSKALIEQSRKEYCESLSEEESDDTEPPTNTSEVDSEASPGTSQEQADVRDQDEVILEAVTDSPFTDLDALNATDLDLFPEETEGEISAGEDADDMTDFLDDFEAYSPEDLGVAFAVDDT